MIHVDNIYNKLQKYNINTNYRNIPKYVQDEIISENTIHIIEIPKEVNIRIRCVAQNNTSYISYPNYKNKYITFDSFDYDDNKLQAINIIGYSIYEDRINPCNLYTGIYFDGLINEIITVEINNPSSEYMYHGDVRIYIKL